MESKDKEIFHRYPGQEQKEKSAMIMRRLSWYSIRIGLTSLVVQVFGGETLEALEKLGGCEK